MIHGNLPEPIARMVAVLRQAALDGHNYVGAAADMIERLAAAPAASWQPIETAPRDGTEIWAYCNGEQAVMQWIEGDEYALWSYADELLQDVCPDPEAPTHWMLLPAPPK